MVRESRQRDIEERVFLPRAPRAVASPVVEELELRRAMEELLPYVNVEEARAELRRMAADPRFHGRRPGEFRVVLASWGSGPAALEEIGREYRAWCTAVRRTNCHEGPLTDSSIYEIAFDFAMGSQWDGFVGEVKSTIDPSTIRLVLLTGLVIFMATIAIPELVSKIPAAAATMVLTAYLGARAVCDLVFGWIQMVRELDAATTFNELRAAGERYGRLVGAQTARILILLATAAIAQGGLIARLMKLPRATQASAALAAESGGVALEAVGAVKEVRVLQGGVAIAVEGVSKGAVGVAMASHDALEQPGQPQPRPAPRTPLRGSPAKAARLVPELGRKLEYFLGRATGNAHTIQRSAQMLSQLERIGLPDSAATRQYLTDHLTGVLNDPSNIARVEASGRVVRESLLTGPGGVLKLETIWEGNKLLTGNLFGGP
jgi:hypothetical protein